MGVVHLDTFAREAVPNGYLPIDIAQEVRNYVNTVTDPNPPAPVIVIDLISLYQPLSKYDERGLPFGGRFNLAYSVISEFFGKLKTLDVELVFFCNGSVQERKDSAWCERQDIWYTRNLTLFDAVDEEVAVEDFVRLHWNMLNFRLPMTNVAKKYGVFKLAPSLEYHQELVAYAIESNALAIISNDSDFLIYEGSWRYWATHSLDLTALTTKEYNRPALRHYLGLTFDQMPLFATLCGNKIMPYRNVVQKLHAQLGCDKDIFFNVARLTRALLSSTVPLQQTDIINVLKRTTNRDDEVDKELVKRFELSLHIYSLNVTQKNVNPSGDPTLEILITKDTPFSYLIWQRKPVDVAVGIVDMRHPKCDYSQLLIALIVRMAGIILFHQNEPQRPTHCPIIIKLNHASLHQEHRFPIEYPRDVEPPTMIELLSTDPAVHKDLQDVKFQLLTWIVSDTLQPDRLQRIPEKFRLTVYTLYYLVQQDVLELFEADLFLRVAYDVLFETYDVHSVEYPKTIKGRPYRAVFVYQKVYAFTRRAFRLLGASCGRDQLDYIPFDGVLFHKRYDEWSHGLYEMGSIKHWRIYEELISPNRAAERSWNTVTKNRRKNNL